MHKSKEENQDGVDSCYLSFQNYITNTIATANLSVCLGHLSVHLLETGLLKALLLFFFLGKAICTSKHANNIEIQKIKAKAPPLFFQIAKYFQNSVRSGIKSLFWFQKLGNPCRLLFFFNVFSMNFFKLFLGMNFKGFFCTKMNSSLNFILPGFCGSSLAQRSLPLSAGDSPSSFHTDTWTDPSVCAVLAASSFT